MRRLSICVVLSIIACGHDGVSPLSRVDGGTFDLTSSSEGPPPVVVNRFTDAANGSVHTDYMISERISFPSGSGRARSDFTSSQVVVTPGMPVQTFTGTGQSNGTWSQDGNKVVISWQYYNGGTQATIVDTLELRNGNLVNHWPRQGCGECSPQAVDVTYVRGAP